MEKEKSKTIQIRVTPAEKVGLGKAAEIAGISLSAWIRERLRFAAIRELEAADKKVPFIKPIQVVLGNNDD